MMTGPANFEQLKNRKKPRVFEPWSSEMTAGPAKTRQNTNSPKSFRVYINIETNCLGFRVSTAGRLGPPLKG